MWVLWATAEAADTFDSSNLLGMGRVGVASADENAAITLNPGLLALTRRYDFQGQFRYGPDAGMMWGANIVDGRTSEKLAGGFSYSGDAVEPPLTVNELPGWSLPGADIPNRKRHHDFALGLGAPMADRRLSLGVGLNLGYFDNDRQGEGWLFDTYVGLGARPVEVLTAGLSLRGFLPLGTEDRPTEVAGGVRLDPDFVSLEGDAVWDTSLDTALPVTFAAGVEKALAAARLRAGWRREAATGDHALALGLGITDQGASIEYGTLLPLTGAFTFDRTVHQVSLHFAAPEPIEEP